MEKDGGSAFPEIETDAAYNDDRELYGHTYSYGGMSLRDYFAAKALTGYLCGRIQYEEPHCNGPEDAMRLLATDCYDMADAMLKARGTDR